MNIKLLVALSFFIASGAATASEGQDLAAVEVHGKSDISLACQDPKLPARSDVERILHITDVTETNTLRRKLMHAAAKGCKAGYEKIAITVTRRHHGTSVSWKQVQSDARIAGAQEGVTVAEQIASK